MNDLDAIIRKAAASRATGSRYSVDELYNEAWVYAHEPSRAKSIQHHLSNTFQDDAHEMALGELRLFRMLHKYLGEYILEQSGLAPRDAERPTYGWGQQKVEVHNQSRHLAWDGEPDEWAEYTLGEAFPHSDGDYKQGYTILHVASEPQPQPQKHTGRYGSSQVFPFGIIRHARDLGIISEYQATLLQFLMDGDSAKDLACRYPEESYGAVQTAVSKALTALRKEPKIQEWAMSLGHNPLATKGERWVSEHRHNDGLPGAPVPQRPFVCDCDRGEADYDEHALDRSDPFLKLSA